MPTVTSYNLGRPKFVADEGSVMLLGTGAQIDWATVTADADGIKRLSAGTILHRAGDGTVRESDGVTGALPAFGILVSDVDNERGQNQGFHGVYIGGHFYGNLLPTAPVAADLTNLGDRFVFVDYSDTRLS